MRNWLKFLVIPIIILWVLELLASIVLGGMYGYESHSFAGLVSTFTIYFLGGVAVYQLSPISNKLFPAIIFSIIYIGLGVYLGIITDGNTTEIIGEEVIHEFRVLPEIVRAAGMLVASFGAHKNEIDENQVKAPT